MESCTTTKSQQHGEYLSYLRNVQEKGVEYMSDYAIFGHLTANLSAGSDTTAMALRAIFYFLVKNPRTYEKLMQEIDAADAEEFSEGQQLEYLQAVIKEAMRLHPGVGMPLERVVPEGGATLCGELIPGGTVVGVNAWVVHHSKEVFGFDTYTFRPERWLEARPDQLRLMEQSSFAFGHGSRACIGKNISMLEIIKLVPQVLRHFRLEWASPQEEWAICGVWFAKQSGVIMRVIPRV
ncbi:Pisatin demethylase [Lachnellula hyalina]|uniref:Pisatin demethylase n=1 Tax=Lachnellula hyalina TaxID=1316788 RepID=A0A8H8QY48_9HELO|nr:Pisatin demethylase [Lachnellula hyalina]TVY24275.1 Pisatin demethylase [Lachnellula hyalina]